MEFKKGGLYNFVYKQPVSGESKRHLAKVMGVRTLTEEDRRKLDSESDYRRWDGEFERGLTLVTCLMPNGNIRNFYAERTENARKASLLERVLYSLGLARILYG